MFLERSSCYCNFNQNIFQSFQGKRMFAVERTKLERESSAFLSPCCQSKCSENNPTAAGRTIHAAETIAGKQHPTTIHIHDRYHANTRQSHNKISPTELDQCQRRTTDRHRRTQKCFPVDRTPKPRLIRPLSQIFISNFASERGTDCGRRIATLNSQLELPRIVRFAASHSLIYFILFKNILFFCFKSINLPVFNCLLVLVASVAHRPSSTCRLVRHDCASRLIDDTKTKFARNHWRIVESRCRATEFKPVGIE
jgi:hypothetical protein